MTTSGCGIRRANKTKKRKPYKGTPTYSINPKQAAKKIKRADSTASRRSRGGTRK